MSLELRRYSASASASFSCRPKTSALEDVEAGGRGRTEPLQPLVDHPERLGELPLAQGEATQDHVRPRIAEVPRQLRVLAGFLRSAGPEREVRDVDEVVRPPRRRELRPSSSARRGLRPSAPASRARRERISQPSTGADSSSRRPSRIGTASALFPAW